MVVPLMHIVNTIIHEYINHLIPKYIDKDYGIINWCHGIARVLFDMI